MLRRVIPLVPAHPGRGEFLLFAFALALATSQAFAQTASVRGFVTDESDGQPLVGVNVVVIDERGELKGTASDADGFFAIARLQPGRYRLRATYIGYDPYVEDLQLSPGQILTTSISIPQSAEKLDEVLIESERETAGAANISAGLQTVRPGDIELVPAPDISADLVNYLTTLPGVVSQGDRGGQLFIRGGEPTQNLILLDGIPVYQPFHIVGFFSAFPSEIITTADVYAGGFGVRYGGRLSSVIDIAARPGNKRRFAGAITAAPFVSSASIEGPIIPGRLSVLASVRRSVIQQGAARIIGEDLPFDFGDAFAKVHATVSNSVQMSITSMKTYDVGKLGVDQSVESDEAEVIRDEVRWKNEVLGMRFLVLPATLPVLGEIVTSYSRLSNAFGPEGDPFRTTSIERFGATSHMTHYIGTIDLHWGLFVHSSRLDANLGGKFQDIDAKKEFVTETGLYIEPELRTGWGAVIRPGIRLHGFPSKSHTFLEPRIRMTWERRVHRISAAAGLYHQEIVGINDRRNAGDVFTAWTTSPLNDVSEAFHAIAGYRIAPSSTIAVSIEGFYKRLQNVLVPEWVAYPRFTTRLQSSDGTVQGLDARLEVTTDAVYAAVTYGLAKVEYTAAFRALQVLTGQSRIVYHPPHDRRHQINTLVGVSRWGFDFNVRWELSSGLPFNESLGFDRYVLLDTLVDLTSELGDERVLYRKPYTGRLPFYHRLDVSVDRTFSIKGRASLTLQAGLINAYDRRNLFYLDLFTLRRVDQLPVIPTLGVKLEIR